MVEVARRYYPFDAMTTFIEGLTLTTSDVVASGGTDVVLTMGEGVFDADLVLDVSAVVINDDTETYTFILEGCNSSAFSSGIEILGMLQIGAAGGRSGAADVDATVGRYAIPVNNMLNGVSYKYVRLNVIIGGDSPSITFDAWLAKRTV